MDPQLANCDEEADWTSKIKKAVMLSTPPVRKQPRKQPLGTRASPELPAGEDEPQKSQTQPLPVKSSSSTAPAPSRQSVSKSSSAPLLGLGVRPQQPERPLTLPAVQESPLRQAKLEGGGSGPHRPALGSPRSRARKCGDEGEPSGETLPARAELFALRKRVHLQACELQCKKNELEMAQRELHQAQQAHDELRIKHSNLERIEQRTSGTLLDERRKNDKLSRQVAAQSRNLMEICSAMEAGAGQQPTKGSSSPRDKAAGMQKQCFKLVQENTSLTVQYGLLRRQRGWAEAKARVLENEVANVYLRNPDNVEDEFSRPATSLMDGNGVEGPYKMLMANTNLRYKETVRDFLTLLVRSQGRDVQSFLQGPRAPSEAIKNECIYALSRELWALWRLDRTLPTVLQSAQRMVHLNEYLEAFEGIANEVMALLGCTGARMWIVDNFRKSIWTCSRGQFDIPITHTFSFSKDPSDLAGRGLAAAAAATEAPIAIADAKKDPRYLEAVDGVSEGQTRSILCVPIMRPGRGQNKVAIVLQAMNKLLEPRFDADFDGEVLKIIGRVATEVTDVCEASGGHLMNAKRKDLLLQLLDEHLPCSEPGHLLHALENGLQKLFKASTVALHVVSRRGDSACSRSTATSGQSKYRGSQYRHTSSSDRPSTAQTAPRRLLRVARDVLRGIVGHVASTKVQASYSHLQLEDSKFDSLTDLPVADGMLHTVPILEDGVCLAVCQFVVPDRLHLLAKQRTMVVDDGTYQSENPTHVGLLQLLLTFVKKHLWVFKLYNSSAVDSSLRGNSLDRLEEVESVHLEPEEIIKEEDEEDYEDEDYDEEDYEQEFE